MIGWIEQGAADWWGYASSDPWWQGAITAFLVFLGIEAVLQVLWWTHRAARRRWPRQHRVRDAWERTFGDRLHRWMGIPSAAEGRERRARARVERRAGRSHAAA